MDLFVPKGGDPLLSQEPASENVGKVAEKTGAGRPVLNGRPAVYEFPKIQPQTTRNHNRLLTILAQMGLISPELVAGW